MLNIIGMENVGKMNKQIYSWTSIFNEPPTIYSSTNFHRPNDTIEIGKDNKLYTVSYYHNGSFMYAIELIN